MPEHNSTRPNQPGHQATDDPHLVNMDGVVLASYNAFAIYARMPSATKRFELGPDMHAMASSNASRASFAVEPRGTPRAPPRWTSPGPSSGPRAGGPAAALSKEFLREVYYGMDLDGDQAVRRPEFTKAFAATWSSALAPLLPAVAGAERREL